MGWRDDLACGFSYKASLNFDFFRSKVTYLPATATGSYAHTPTQNIVEAAKYGLRLDCQVGVWDGIFQNAAEVASSGQPNARVGGMRYRDLDNDGVR